MIQKQRVVLAVDDEPMNLDLLKGILPADIKVRVATNGEKALEIARTEPQPDLIFLDVMMPGLNGYDVCRELKQAPETAAIPVVFLSAMTEDVEQEYGLALGAVAFLAKPVEPAKVHETLKQLFKSGPDAS